MCVCGGGACSYYNEKIDACLEWPPRLKARSAMTTDTKGRKQSEKQDGCKLCNYNAHTVAPVIAIVKYFWMTFILARQKSSSVVFCFFLEPKNFWIKG